MILDADGVEPDSLGRQDLADDFRVRRRVGRDGDPEQNLVAARANF